MKRITIKHLIVALAIACTTPTVAMVPPSTMSVEAATAKPEFYVKKKVITGIDKNYTMHIKNKIKGARYTWSSSNPNIVEVDYKGFLTSVSKGTTTIKCVVKSGSKTYELKSEVIVRVPATQAVINNSKLENNVHTIELGDNYDFNTTLTPKNTSYKTYWTIEDPTIASVDGYGIVRPKAKGMTKLVARASYSKASSKNSVAVDSIYINVIEKTARVTAVNLIGGKELQVSFNHAIEKSTIINEGTGEIKDVLTLSSKKDNSGSMASAPGKLLGKLSTDGKILTITAANEFSGTYDVKVSSAVKTTAGLSVSPYFNEMKLVDTLNPKYVGTTVDDTGLKSLINFNEPVDITELQIISNFTGIDMLSSTKNILINKNSYQLSQDKKSIVVDLTSMYSSERNKSFSVSMSGIKDTAGNYSEPYILNATVKTDTTYKPQANVVSVKRINYNSLVVEYDRGIIQAGRVLINGTYLYGMVDGSDNKKVNYTLSNAQAGLSGIQIVSVTGWNAYNVAPSDTTANKLYEYKVDFTIESNAPTLLNYTVVPITQNGMTNYQLTLTYNKTVTLMMPGGTLNSILADNNNNIYPNNLLSYTATVSGNVVTLTINGTTMKADGVYTATIPSNFVMDLNFNRSLETTVKVTKNAGGGTELPPPTSVVPVGRNMIMVNFACKVDKTTAENISNYMITGIAPGAIQSALLTANMDGMATVTLKLNDNTIMTSTVYPMSVVGIKGADGYSLIKPSTYMVSLMDNTAPTILAVNKAGASLTIIFSENITAGNVYFNVYSASNPSIAQNIPVMVNGNVATTLNLPANMVSCTDLKLAVIPGYQIVDAAGNPIDSSTVVNVQ